jgi:hypothetical protein
MLSAFINAAMLVVFLYAIYRNENDVLQYYLNIYKLNIILTENCGI